MSIHTMSEELKEDLIELGLQRYVSALLNAGYDDWDTIGDMAESDFDALDIRLGDRRKLQREIARRQLWPENSPLPTSDELREYKLSLEDNAAETSKNGYFHHQVSETLESEGISPEFAGTPALAESPQFTQHERPRSVAETSQYADSIPDLALGPEINEYDSTEENAPNYLPISHNDNDDDPTSRPVENRAPLLE